MIEGQKKTTATPLTHIHKPWTRATETFIADISSSGCATYSVFLLQPRIATSISVPVQARNTEQTQIETKRD